MHRTRLSLFYLAGYLLPTGLLLVVAPDVAFKLLFATGQYGDAIPRLAGGVLLALGIMVVQIIRYRVEVMYPTTVGVRLVLLAILGWLYARTGDPFFLIVTGVVGLGVLLTGSTLLMARARATPRPQP
ncbi:MAG TPA: hypothetical protein VND93_00840 [Myxococcales bacterium]|nr:hypothetical protein [Myxococcales bacterium]